LSRGYGFENRNLIEQLRAGAGIEAPQVPNVLSPFVQPTYEVRATRAWELINERVYLVSRQLIIPAAAGRFGAVSFYRPNVAGFGNWDVVLLRIQNTSTVAVDVRLATAGAWVLENFAGWFPRDLRVGFTELLNPSISFDTQAAVTGSIIGGTINSQATRDYVEQLGLICSVFGGPTIMVFSGTANTQISLSVDALLIDRGRSG
jgi:hypothetical protein